MKRAASAIVAALFVGALAAPAGAITYGEPDGNRHPSVGALLAAVPYDDGTWSLCTGTLIAPRWVLTSAQAGKALRDGKTPARIASAARRAESRAS